MENKLAGKTGFTLVEVLVASVMIGIAAIGISSAVIYVSSDMNRLELSTTTNLIRLSFLSYMQNDQAWQATVNHSANTNMACLKTPGGICPTLGMQGAFNLLDAAGNVFFYGSNPNAGFKENGETCFNFDSQVGNDECPFKVDLNWEPDCPAALPSCNPTLVHLSLDFRYFPRTEQKRTNINVSNYQLRIVRKAKP